MKIINKLPTFLVSLIGDFLLQLSQASLTIKLEVLKAFNVLLIKVVCICGC